MIAALLLLQAAPAAVPTLSPAPYPHPSTEAVALGTRLAETGTLASLLPMIAAKETDELVAQHPEFSAEDRAELRRTAAATLATGRAKLFAAEGRAYAERLSVADLRVLAARNGDGERAVPRRADAGDRGDDGRDGGHGLQARHAGGFLCPQACGDREGCAAK